MPGIEQTLLNNYQSKVNERELRVPNYGLIDLAHKQTKRVPFLSKELKTKINTHQGIDLKVPALTEKVITTSTAESFQIPLNLSESAMTTLTFVTIFCGFGIFPETFVNNVISEDEYRLNKMMEVDKAMAKRLEQYIDTHLGVNKTAVWDGAAQAGYTFAANALAVTLAQQKDRMFDAIKIMAAQNNWSEDELDMAATYGIGHVISEYAKYKGMNEKDLTQDIPDIYKSNRVSLTAGKKWTSYLMEPGSIGLVPNYKKSFVDGIQIGGAKWDISDDALPQLGDRVMMFENKEKVDASGFDANSGHALMSWKQEYGFAYRFCLLKRYNSDTATRVGNILKIDGNLT